MGLELYIFFMVNLTLGDAKADLILDSQHGSNCITLANIYAPNNDSPEFYVNVLDQIDAVGNDHRIIGGHFNLVLNKELDQKGGLGNINENAAKLLKHRMQEEELIDIWREQNQDKFGHTWKKINSPQII